MTTSNDPHVAARTASADAVRRASLGALSMRARVGYVGLLLVSVAGAGALASLWATEPVLPVRTHVAFALLLGILLAWAAFATWVLRTRRALFGRDGVIAGRLSVAFSALYTAGMAAAGAGTGLTAPWAGAGVGLLMLAVALLNLRRATRRVETLTAQREALARELGLAAPA
jgi:hypothetical protein